MTPTVPPCAARAPPQQESTRDLPLHPEGHGPYRLLYEGRRALVDRFRAALVDPRAAQEERLQVLLRLTRGTLYGDAHNLDRVRTLADWRAALPLVTHRQLLPFLDRIAAGERDVLTRERVSMLLETSGTTGRPKHLPVTPTWARAVSEAQAMWVLSMVRDHEAVTKGRALTMVSPRVHARSPGGLPIGSNTGRMHARQPWYVKLRFPVPTSVYALKPDQLKWYALLRFALQADIASITTANPSTILLLCRRLLEWREPLSQDLADGTLRHGPAALLPRWTRRKLELRLRKRRPPEDWRPAKLWPLALVNCWKGGPAGYFVRQLPAALGADLPVREVGITASEGTFAIPLGDDWPGGVLWPLGHLMEFIGDDGQARWLWELEQGERVRLVLSGENGLLRYDLRDTLEVVGRCLNTPVMRFVGKTGRWLNATGEKVTEAQVSTAMRDACLAEELAPVGFTVRIDWGAVPRFELAVEGAPEGAMDRLARAFDTALQQGNIEYEAKRSSDRIGPASARLLSRGSYVRWREARVEAGAPEGQVKDPVIAVDDTEWDRILAAHRGG
jgi:hypothetical protein